jgi:hypothetical protein
MHSPALAVRERRMTIRSTLPTAGSRIISFDEPRRRSRRVVECRYIVSRFAAEPLDPEQPGGIESAADL